MGRLLSDIRAIPGVTGAALGTVHPLDPGWTATYSGAGEDPPGGSEPRIRTRWVSDGYFRVAGIPVLLGRELASSDRGNAEPVAVLNESAARLLFPSTSPLGRRVRVWDDRDRRVVGVVGDVRFMGVHQPAEPAIYAAYFQMPTGFCNVVLRSGLGADALRQHLRSALDQVDPQLSLSPVRGLTEALDEPRERIHAAASLAGSMAVVVLLVSAIGLYALMTAGAAAWRLEIGVRMTVGATRSQIATLIARRGLRVLLAGVLLGVLAALGTSRLLLTLYTIEGGLGSLHLLAALAVLVAATLPALLLPALRASRVDPLALLRHD